MTKKTQNRGKRRKLKPEKGKRKKSKGNESRRRGALEGNAEKREWKGRIGVKWEIRYWVFVERKKRNREEE